MKIVIDMPVSIYNDIIECNKNGSRNLTYFELITVDGTLLPKGYGRLIDADTLRKTVSLWGLDDYTPEDFINEIDQTPTIIEADKEEGTCSMK